MHRTLKYTNLIGILLATFAAAPVSAEDIEFTIPIVRTDDEESSEDEDATFEMRLIQDQPQPLAPVPSPVESSVLAPEVAASLSNVLFGLGGMDSSLLSSVRRQRAAVPGTDIVLGTESGFRATTDTGSLLGKSLQTRGLTPQNRTPIITDTRVRGAGFGGLLASGSYWVPARQDLDTMLSKVDSRLINDIIIIKGPYSAMYGPGTSFIDFSFIPTPRYEDGHESHHSTSLDYKDNGEQFYGRETVWGGGSDYGYRVGYGHRTGNDYTMGDGRKLPTSYNSRDLDVALGYDIDEFQSLEFSYLRLDQTGVESPGQFFDINFLVTDAFELNYTLVEQAHFDRLTANGWYNRTRFAGDAQRPGKRMQIPSIALVTNDLETDVDSMSTGFSTAVSWGEIGSVQLTLGSDMRFLKQELNELNDFDVDVDPGLAGALGIPPGIYNFQDANSPIPRSYWSNPGLFTELNLPATEQLSFRAGGRLDFLNTDVTKDPPGLSSTLPTQVPLDRAFLTNQLRTDDLAQDFVLWSVFGSGEYRLNDNWTFGGAAGVGMRPPTLTELYATGPFLSVVQNGFNSVIGDPNLDAAQHTQLDLNVRVDTGRFRGGLNGFYAWVKDYITYEVVLFGALPEENTRALTYVNTPHATLAGGEAFAEYDVNDWLTPFVTASYVEGRDHTRSAGGMQFYNPAFATFTIDPNAPRGVLPGADEEPLPSISPLEARAGFWIRQPAETPTWGVEFSARIVDSQDRVASSIGELPTAGFTTYNLRGFWQATERLTLVGGVENLTNKFYREHLDLRTGRGVFQPGITFYTGAQMNW